MLIKFLKKVVWRFLEVDKTLKISAVQGVVVEPVLVYELLEIQSQQDKELA